MIRIVIVLAIALLASVARADDPDQILEFTGPEGERIEGAVWLPDESGTAPRPLVVISHGNGGWHGGHHDTAEALAEAGFVVAALTHPGDNRRDQSRATHLSRRAPQLSALIDHMIRDWSGPARIDAERIGAFGFSAGGFTVTDAIGGVSSAGAILEHCAAHPQFFACKLVAAGGLDEANWRTEARDARIKAAVMAAPALGFSFTTESLAAITIPVQLWQAGEDEILPRPYNVEPIRDRLARAPDYRLVADAMHFDFLTPCEPDFAAELPFLCTSKQEFDRAAFKAEFNGDVVRFFVGALAPVAPLTGR